MGKWTPCKKKVYITLTPNTDKISEIIEGSDNDISVLDIDATEIEVEVIMEGRTYYDPGVRYDSNGEGYPPEYDEEFPLDEDCDTAIAQALGGFFDVSINVNEEAEYEEDDYYD